MEDSFTKSLQKIIERQKAEIFRLRSVIESLPGAIYWKDKDGVYLGLNSHAVERVQNLKLGDNGVKEAFIGKTDYDFFSKKVADQYRKDDLEVMATEKELSVEGFVPLPKEGTITQLLTKRPLYSEGGKVVGVVGNVIDITELKSMEKKLIDAKSSAIHDLQYIISEMPGYVYWKNKKSEYMGCNKELARFSRLKKSLDIVGKTDYDFEWGKKQADQFIKDDQFVMKTGKTLITEHKLSKKRVDGKKLYVRTEKMPFHDRHGRTVGVLAVAIDITEQKELENKLIAEKNKAERANIVKTEFMRNMEHDIRTPFSGVWGMANHLLEIEKDSTKKEYLSDITQCAKELLGYCNSILDFSQIELGMLTVIDKKFNLEKLIDSVIKIELPAAKIKGFALKTNYDPTIPEILIGDPYRIHRILINLISNAIKFTQKGYITLKVLLLKKTIRSLVVRFIVEDTGIGIPSDKQEFIFEKFSRLSLSNKGMYKGIGLGLRIVKQFIHEIDGEIDLVSKVGEGTQFICTVPFKLPLTNDFAD